MKKILFPTDFSGAARGAFEYALALAEALDATIDVLSIYFLPGSEAASVPPQHIEQLLTERKSRVTEQLHAFLADYSRERIGQLRIDYGVFIYQEIIDAAADGEHDLIVMGTKGEHNRMEKLLGSVTTHTMMHAPCPVLAIPENVRFEPIRKIAYATDFQASDEHAVEELIMLAGELGAEVHFVHIDTNSGREAKAAVEDLGGESPFPFTQFTVVRSPTAQEGVDYYLQQESINLLALFIPRRRFWERLFHSSFSKKMTFHSKTPLLVFHE